MSSLKQGDRVYHRRSDLFGRIEALHHTIAAVKYEWPYDPEAEASDVPLAELIPDYEVQGA